MNRLKKVYKALKAEIDKTASNSIPDDPLACFAPFKNFSDIKGIIVCDEPYKYQSNETKPLARGRVFTANGSKEPVALITIKQAFAKAVKNIHGIGVEIDSDLQVLSKLGILVINVNWTTDLGKKHAHHGVYTVNGKALTYSMMTVAVVNNVLSSNEYRKFPVLLMGTVAQELAPKFKTNCHIIRTTHPAAVKSGHVFDQTRIDEFILRLNGRKDICKVFVR